MSLVREQVAFMSDLTKLLQHASDKEFLVTGGELERKPEMQALYIKSGYASSMDSMHLRRCAINLYFYREEGEDDLRLVQNREELVGLGDFWESLDPRNSWGGRTPGLLNTPRFERNLGAWPGKAVASLTPAPSQARRLQMAPSGGDRASAVLMPEEVTRTQRVTLRRGSNQTTAISSLQSQLVALKLLERGSGEFDVQTERAVVEFQRRFGLVSDGVVGEKTWSTLQAQQPAAQEALPSLWLSDQDLEEAARSAGLLLPAMMAVYKVESNGNGFIERQPKILFEGHVFWSQLEKAGLRPESLQKGNEDILYRSWSKAHYKGGAAEHQRLKRAQAIHVDAALASASWGLFQIMGYHWKSLGYDSVTDFANRMAEHERDQLDAFVRYLKVTKTRDGRPLADVLNQQQWADFAYAYNGPGYRANRYDDKLRDAFRKYSA